MKIFGIPTGELINRIFSAEDIFGAEAASLRERLLDATSMEEARFSDRFLFYFLTKQNLPVSIFHGDVTSFRIQSGFDAAYCLGNSFGYVDYEGMNLFVQNVSSGLNAGARFVINSGLVAESILPNFPTTKQYILGDLKMDISNSYNSEESCMMTELTYTKPGRTEKHLFKHYVYTLSEIRRMLKSNGLQILEYIIRPT